MNNLAHQGSGCHQTANTGGDQGRWQAMLKQVLQQEQRGMGSK